MSQKNGQTARQIKTLEKGAAVKSSDCADVLPAALDEDSKKEADEENKTEGSDDTKELDVVSYSPVNNNAESKSCTETDSREISGIKDVPRPSAFSPVTPNRDGADALKSPVQQTKESQAPAISHPSFPWGRISSPIGLNPVNPLIVPEYTSYTLPDRHLYPAYYHPGHPHVNEPNSSFQSEFLDPQRPMVQQPITPPHATPFPPYPYRYSHAFHPGPALHYTLYRPRELPMPITGPGYLPLDFYGQTLGHKDYDFYMYSRFAHSRPHDSTQEESHHDQNVDKATRQSPKEGYSALGSPDKPSQANFIPREAEASQYAGMCESQIALQQGHAATAMELLKKDPRQESAETFLQLRTQHPDMG